MDSLETSYMNTLAADNVTGVAMQWTYRDGEIVYQPTITSPFDIFVHVKKLKSTNIFVHSTKWWF